MWMNNYLARIGVWDGSLVRFTADRIVPARTSCTFSNSNIERLRPARTNVSNRGGRRGHRQSPLRLLES